MNKVGYRKTLLILLSLQSCASVATESYSCPNELLVNSTVETVPDQWTAKNSRINHYLVSSGFSDGHPSEQVFLRPSKKGESPNSGLGSDVDVYDLSDISEGGVWLVCGYGNTSATLVQKLRQTYSTCEVSLFKDSSEQKVICKK